MRQDLTEGGSGLADWKRVLPAAYRADVGHCFVEQEPPYEFPPLEALRKSFGYLDALVA